MSNFFGPQEGIDTKDYIFKMEGDSPTSRPEVLVGHTLTNPNVELSDALTVTRVKLSQGRIRTVTLTKRAPEERSRQYTIGFPSGALWTPATEAAARQGCRKTFWMVYSCPEDSRYGHAEILPDALLDPQQPEGDVITVDDESVITSTSTLRISQQMRLWAVGSSLIYTASPANQFHAIEFTTADCPTCADVPGLGMIATGGDGTADIAELTDDRFVTQTALSTGATATNYATALYTEGALIVVGYADDPDFSSVSATVGELFVSHDGGSTFTAITGVTEPIYDVERVGNALIAVGGPNAGQSVLYASFDNGFTWESVTDSDLPATASLSSLSYDEETGRAYAVGDSGSLVLIEVFGTTVNVVDLSSNLAGSPGALWVAKVLGKDYVAVGGAAGYYAESQDGGLTFTEMSPAGSDIIKAIAGNVHRTMIGAASTLYKRDVMTDFQFEAVDLENGVTVSNNYTDGNEGIEGDFNLFAFATDGGEVVFTKPFYPNA